MLTSLAVKNFAVVAATDLDLERGMTVLSGETGAGKSIVVGALGLVLGARADAGIIRDGTESAEISAHFEAPDAVLGWLETQGLDAGGECLVRRVISREGRSRAWVNGSAVTLKTLSELGAMLVDIHGQHAHQSLTSRTVQREIVDSFADNVRVLNQIETAYEEWLGAARELEQLEEALAERDSRLDLARFQLQELDALAPEPGESAGLVLEHKRMAHAGRLAEDAAQALALLEDDDEQAAQARVARAAHLVAPMAQIDAQLANTARMLAEAEIQLSEAAAELGEYLSTIDLEPARRDFVEQRLATMQALARKHRVDPDDLASKRDELARELALLEDAGERREALQLRVTQTKSAYDKLAAALHRRRQKAAKKLDAAITAELHELGMDGGVFATQIRSDPAQARRHGTDTIEFRVSANAGQAPRALARVASGGELSRISLAIEVLAARHQPVPTMIFDEIDTGVGGGIAEIIGQKLRLLGATTQVLCVTHLPQVASQAHHHVLVAKTSDAQRTETSLERLGELERAEEIARMLGGVEITAATRRHAREMLARAETVAPATAAGKRGSA